jgi:ABC-type multidrug transport system fused ATPase/permease subunit
MKEIFKNSTVLTIAHRIDTIIESDKILVMKDGKKAEFDRPSVLLNNKESLFYKLY